MKRLHLVEAGSAEAEATRVALPEHVQLSLVGIAESAKEGLMALAVGAGLARRLTSCSRAISPSWSSRS